MNWHLDNLELRMKSRHWRIHFQSQGYFDKRRTRKRISQLKDQIPDLKNPNFSARKKG